LMVGQNYDVTRNSPLKIITKDNVAQMVPLFAVDLCGWSCTPPKFAPTDRVANGSHPSEEAVSVVADGFLYIEDGLSKVSKIDVRSGTKGTFVWRYDPKITSYRDRKGVALMNTNVYVCAGSARGIALDMNSGEVKYDTDLHAPNQPGATILKDIPGQTMTAPPMVVKSAAGQIFRCVAAPAFTPGTTRLMPSMPTPASSCGGSIRFQDRDSPASRAGRTMLGRSRRSDGGVTRRSIRKPTS